MKKKKILDESYYQNKWDREKTYSYDPSQKKENTFVIDTPPPTISGSLHIGHVFSYTQTDILARFQRMSGKNVFYPMGWDNNGLPTERRVQNLYKITCDPSISKTEDPDFEEILSRSPLTKLESSKKSDTSSSTSSIQQEATEQNQMTTEKQNPGATKKQKKISHFKPVSREAFIRVCSQQTKQDQKQYERLWRKLALSVDWSQTYETIGFKSQFISQRSFLDLYQKGFVENRYTPVFWDTQFQTAVAQADMEDRKKTGFYHDIKFKMLNGGEEFFISTTRPELLPACVALTAHPEDERYKKFFHKEALTPLFSSVVPVLPSLHADPEKGTGILMVCTFGDMEDLLFWEKHKLDLKQIIGPDGFLKDIRFQSGNFEEARGVEGAEGSKGAKGAEGSGNKLSSHTNTSLSEKVFFSLYPEEAHKYYKELKGLRVEQARRKISELLKETKYLVSEPKPTEQFVKFYEKGDFPLELIPTRQWYIKILDYKKELLEQGRKVSWNPPSMLKRYEQWVEGLNQNWCISRQRFFGVPFPVWYPLDKNKVPDYNKPILPSVKFLDNLIRNKLAGVSLNLDPLSSAPADWNTKWAYYTEDKRGKREGFTADTAVMDTWATSSLTPQINSHWKINEERHKKLFPADLRPQAHEIIRTWAFYTIVKSFFHNFPKSTGDSTSNNLSDKLRVQTNFKNIPWKNIAISGWVMDPERLKISKSKNKKGMLSPEDLIEEYSADALRYWAGKARLGMDTIFDENMFKTGKKLIIKLNNAFKFVQIQIKGRDSFFEKHSFNSFEDLSMVFSSNTFFGFKKSLSYVSDPIDKAWLIYLLDTHFKATAFLNNFHYSKALDLIEKSFWLFCDNYLELVKGRAYRFRHLLEDVSSVEEDFSSVKGEIFRANSAVLALDISMYLFVKMFAPYMPYITEHIWSKRYAKTDDSSSYVHGNGKSGVHGKSSPAYSLTESETKPSDSSLHISSWGNMKLNIQVLKKEFEESLAIEGSKKNLFDFNRFLFFCFNLLEQIRNSKSARKKSLSTPVKQLKIQMREEEKTLFKVCKQDIAYSAHVRPENIFIEDREAREDTSQDIDTKQKAREAIRQDTDTKQKDTKDISPKVFITLDE